MRIALKFAYNGKNFHSYARQPDLQTVEGDIIKILQDCKIIENTKNSKFRSASRTDKNVSALANVISFDSNFPKKEILHNLIKKSSNILFYGIKDVENIFNPRFARIRKYRYFLKKNGLDIEKIIKCSDCFTGENNFRNFAKIESFKNPIRSIDNIIFHDFDDFLIIDFFAQTFLWHQIRRIVSAMYKVGMGSLDKKQIVKALDEPNRKIDFGLAPPDPLILMYICYNFEFEYNKKQYEKIKEIEKDIIKNLSH
jgi:tRNA pseudouridine38-40 synthase